MSGIKVVVLEDNIPRIISGMNSGAARVIAETCFDIEARAKSSMAGAKSGRVYPHKGGKMHQASAPGEAPAIDTGNLVNSIQVQVSGFTGIVYTNTEYAPVLEFGGAKMAARPFFTPAATEAWPDFLEAMKRIADGG
jgi:phage gpG-like protein